MITVWNSCIRPLNIWGVIEALSYVPRLPSISRFMWDGEACGRINFRWREGATDLPSTCLEHIGYDVFSWKRRNGYASEALKQILPEAVALGMPFVELTTDLDNEFSQRVIQKMVVFFMRSL